MSVPQAQLVADRMNASVPAEPPPADLRCAGAPSSVVIVTFTSAAGSTAVEVLAACKVFRSGRQVRRATPGVLGQVAAAAS